MNLIVFGIFYDEFIGFGCYGDGISDGGVGILYFCEGGKLCLWGEDDEWNNFVMVCYFSF